MKITISIDADPKELSALAAETQERMMGSFKESIVKSSIVHSGEIEIICRHDGGPGGYIWPKNSCGSR